jgi:phosphoribosylglycinamide formyltransferase 2
MVTLISQNFNEFELHLRAILGLPIPKIEHLAPAASAVILAEDNAESVYYEGVTEALQVPDVDIRLFGKPNSRPYRRMGVALAKGETIAEARKKATEAARKVKVCSL